MTSLSPPTSSSTHEGEAEMLQALVNLGLTLRLFSNDISITRSNTSKSFVEAAFPGYKPTPLSPSSWKISVGQGLTPSKAIASPVSFSRNASGLPVDIYGWYLTTPSGTIVSSGRFPKAPWDMRQKEDSIKINPSLSMPS